MLVPDPPLSTPSDIANIDAHGDSGVYGVLRPIFESTSLVSDHHLSCLSNVHNSSISAPITRIFILRRRYTIEGHSKPNLDPAEAPLN